MIARKVLLMNLILLAGVIILAQQLVQAWKSFEGPPNLQVTAQQVALESLPEVEASKALPQFLVIAEKNLFASERGLVQPEEAGEEEEMRPPELAVKPDLVGVSVFGNDRQATVIVYEGKRSQGQTRNVKLGDDIQNYTVSEIGDEELKMKWRDHVVVLDLDLSAAKPAKPNQAPSRQAVNIIRVGSAAAAVETTAAAEQAEETRGLEVGVVRASQQTRRGGLSNGQGGAQAGRGLGPGANNGSGLGNQAPQLPGTVGLGSQIQPPAQNRPQ